jgi:hypothetical protein
MGFASPQEAMAFYGEVINQHRFDALLPVLAEEVSFWFSSGSHSGLAASRQAFEKTWARIVDERYWLEDLHWLAIGDESAACSYHFHWTGRMNNVPAAGGGRGTTVLRRDPAGWVIVHEHLSAEPT